MTRKGSRRVNDQIPVLRHKHRSKLSAGVWSGDSHPQAQIRVELAGTGELVQYSSDEPEETEILSIGECALAVCLRLAASFVKVFKPYLLSKTAGGFLPFLQVEECRAFSASKQRVASESMNNARETVFGAWRAEAMIKVAHSRGVNEKTVRELFEVAGTKVGLGLHSPRWRGANGAFVISSISLMKGSWPEYGKELVMLGPVGQKLERGEDVDVFAEDE